MAILSSANLATLQFGKNAHERTGGGRAEALWRAALVRSKKDRDHVVHLAFPRCAVQSVKDHNDGSFTVVLLPAADARAATVAQLGGIERLAQERLQRLAGDACPDVTYVLGEDRDIEELFFGCVAADGGVRFERQVGPRDREVLHEGAVVDATAHLLGVSTTKGRRAFALAWDLVEVRRSSIEEENNNNGCLIGGAADDEFEDVSIDGALEAEGGAAQQDANDNNVDEEEEDFALVGPCEDEVNAMREELAMRTATCMRELQPTVDRWNVVAEIHARATTASLLELERLTNEFELCG